MLEQWKDIYFWENGVEYDYRGLYQVSNLGNVKSLGNGNNTNAKERMLKAGKRKDGYLQLTLYKNGKKKQFLIHRLVAYMFIDGYFNGAEVNHIDENKENNSIENLEWMTPKQNCNHGTRNKRMTKTRNKKVIGYSLTETKVIILQSTHQAEKFGFNQGAICECCNGKRKSHKGFIFKYHENNKREK